MMTEVPIIIKEETQYLDVCAGCYFIWFDPQEFERLPKLQPAEPEGAALPLEARQALAWARLEILKEEQEFQQMRQASPDHWWQLILGFFGMPIEYDYKGIRAKPIVTWVLSAGMVIITIVALYDLEAAVTSWGLVPAQFGRYFGLTFITSFFLHGGLFHLIGNLYFLLVFGDNVEDVLGGRQYLQLVAASAIVGAITHVISDPISTAPYVGASAGISGIIAYYALRFPRTQIGLPVCFGFRWIRVPVAVMFCFWVLMQIFGAIKQLSGFSNVSALAHLGGAGVGIFFWWIMKEPFVRIHAHKWGN